MGSNSITRRRFLQAAGGVTALGLMDSFQPFGLLQSADLMAHVIHQFLGPSLQFLPPGLSVLPGQETRSHRQGCQPRPHQQRSGAESDQHGKDGKRSQELDGSARAGKALRG